MEKHTDRQRHGMYRSFAAELAIDFVIMYLVMYTMIDSPDHFYLNNNNAYMTLMMVAPMALVMLVGMRSMFPSAPLNLAIGAGALVIFVVAFAAMRSQAAVGDEQFLRAMIPHHSGAILMCERAPITDTEIKRLCVQIVDSQKEEISQMQALLARL